MDLKKAFIFDLDGTLLDTLSDLVAVTNKALASVGLPERSREEILSYIGNGGHRLVEAAAPEGTPRHLIEHAFESWKMLNLAYGAVETAPFEGMTETLAQLKGAGVRLAVFSNKFDDAARMLIEKYYPETFDVVRGERSGVPRKPDPAGLLATIEDLGVPKSDAVYVGDSLPDIEAASRGGVSFIGVSWGYGDASFASDARFDERIERPSQLLSYVQHRR